MNPNPPLRPRSRTRGSAFITVMLYSFLLLSLVATILQWSLSERRMNSRAAYFLEARNAAEALAEYGFSQIRSQFASHAVVPSFDPQGSSPLTLPPSHTPLQAGDFFYGSNVDTNPYSAGTHPTGLELIGGTAQSVPPSGALFLVDANDPNNTNDTLKGEWVYRRDIQVLARATVVPPNGDRPVTAYITEKVSVRGAPLFANAIFYSNNDLEIFPGPQMDIYGPVHCNGNMFVSNQSNSTGLLFHGPVSCSGNIYHAWASEAHAGDGSGSEALGTNPVSFVTSAGTMLALKDSSNVWRDSTLGADSTLFSSGLYINTTTAALTQLQAKLSANFRATASQLWGGNLQTAAMGVAAYNPVGTGSQVGVDGSGNPIYANVGSVNATTNQVIDPTAADPLGYGAHSMIDPPNTALTSSDPYYSGKSEVENQKFSMKAGLYVQVVVTPGTSGTPDTATVKLYGWPGSAPSGTPASNIGPNTGILLGTVPSGLVTFVPYKATQRTVSGGSGSYTVTTTTYSATTSISASTTTSSNPGALQVVNQGLFDRRQMAGINLVQVDMAALRAAVNDTLNVSTADGKAIVDASGNVWGASSSGTSGTGYDPTVSGSNGWNGAVYVEVKTSNASTTQTSVAMANGQVDSGNGLLPTLNSSAGLTVATNAPMYVLGPFNADGSNATTTGVSGSGTTPDDGRTDAVGTATSAEVPAALAADAITVLSPGYFGTPGTNGASAPSSNTSSTNAGVSWSTAKPDATDHTEVAAAFITGLVRTSSSANSGGAHNLPRFIEDWSGKTVAIRGSLVSMFQSKVATGTFSTAYYGAPTRNWGFDKIFQNGHFPPMTPKVMSYRRTDFTDLSAGDYTSARTSLWPSLP
ncbi:MAG TPA: hypothetical protein VMF63_01760 [Opitutaceae bacterium]|nr:hypothetical protein [Opitutaceae bacterium]